MALNPFRRNNKTIEKAIVIGDVVFTEGEQLPMPLRNTLEREYRALQRGASGVSDSGLAEAVKLSVPAYTCIKYFATTARSVPLAVNTGVVTDFHPFNFFMTQSGSIIELSVISLLIWGKVFLRKHYNDRDELGMPAGYPTGLEYINPNNIEQRTDSRTGVITGYKLKRTNEDIPVNEIIYIAAFDPSGDGNPLSALENCFTHLGVEQGIASYAVSFFFNKALPVGIMKFNPPLDPTEFERFKKSWKNQFRGSNNANKTAFLNGNGEWQSIQDPPKDLAMSELTDNSKQMIAASFNVPAELVGLADTSSSSLSQEQITATRRAFLEASVIPTVQYVLEQLNNQWMHVDFSPPNFYSLVTNEKAMQIFSSVSLDTVNMTISLVEAGTIDFEQQRKMLEIEAPQESEDRLFITAPPGNALSLYNDGAISLNTARKMVGLETVSPDRWKIDGKTVPSFEVNAIISSPPNMEDNTGEILISEEPILQLPEKSDVISLPPLLEQPSRTAVTTIMAVDFSKHNFVKTAQRKLAKKLGELNVNGISWIHENDWRLELVSFEECTYTHVARMMRELDLGHKMKVELFSHGYTVRNNSIYWAIDTSKELTLFRSSLTLQVADSFDLAGSNLPIIGIKLCDCETDSLTDDMLMDDVIDMPLVVDNISLFVGGDVRHKWQVQRVTESQRAELAQWRNKYRTHSKRGIAYKDVEFAPDELPQHVVDYVRDEMAKDECDVNDVFAEARSRLQNRAIQSTLIDFELWFEDVLSDARAGNIERARFTNILRNGINRFGNLAYRDGLVDGGVLDGAMDTEDVNIANRLIKDNQSFAKNLSARVYSDDGISDEEAASRPQVWAKNVIMTLYNAGRVSANANGMYEFVRMSSTVDTCRDCVRLEGQVHRLKDWASHNLLVPSPGRQKTDCEGWQCGHGLVPVTARANGRF